ncbi:hypothetical protein ACKVMT_02805 [Halobacteriales archaeon Cl-PHB]
MEHRVTEKVERLPARFEHLFEDVELLESRFQEGSNLLATEAGTQAWLELMGLEGATGREVEDAMSPGRGSPGSAPAEFGAKLGRTVGRLMRWPTSNDSTAVDIMAELVWGFLRGLLFDGREAGAVTETTVRDETSAVIDRIEERANAFAEARDTDSPPEFARQLQAWQEKRREMALAVEKVLSDESSLSDDEMPIALTTGLEQGTGMPSEFYREVVDHLIDRAVDEDQQIDSRRQDWAFLEQYGPAEEFDADAFVTASEVLTVVEDRQLIEKYELKCDLEEEAETLAEKGRKGVSATEVLPRVVADGPLSSKEIAQQLHDTRDYTAAVTRLARDLAGVESGSTQRGIDIWTERPLLVGDPEEWDTTAYGEAAAHALDQYLAHQEQEPYGLPLELRPFPDDLLGRALAEVADGGDAEQ